MIKDVTTWKGIPVSFEWFEDIHFKKLKDVNQSYGICFDKKGKITIINVSGYWCLPGGTPEKGETYTETLVREVMEEADLELENILPLGYQRSILLDNNESSHQLRFIAKIKKILPQTPDPANGKVSKRKFIAPEEFLKYCPWGKTGEAMIKAAIKLYNLKSS